MGRQPPLPGSSFDDQLLPAPRHRAGAGLECGPDRLERRPVETVQTPPVADPAGETQIARSRLHQAGSPRDAILRAKAGKAAARDLDGAGVRSQPEVAAAVGCDGLHATAADAVCLGEQSKRGRACCADDLKEAPWSSRPDLTVTRLEQGIDPMGRQTVFGCCGPSLSPRGPTARRTSVSEVRAVVCRATGGRLDPRASPGRPRWPPECRSVHPATAVGRRAAC